MFLELIAVIFAGIAAAGVVMLLNRTLKGRLPRWMAPVAGFWGIQIPSTSCHQKPPLLHT